MTDILGNAIFFDGYVYQLIPGSIGETSTLAILVGAAILIFTGIGSWKTMLSVFVGGGAMAALFNVFWNNSCDECITA